MRILFVVILLYCSSLYGQSKLDKAHSLMMEERYGAALTILNQHSYDKPKYYYTKSICEYALFKRQEGIKSARRLLSFGNLPRRYKYMGEHIKYELENMNPDTLDHVSMLMKDSQRRLKLGQGGPKVQHTQAKAVAILDYLIEKREQQQGGGSASEKCPGQQRIIKTKTNDPSKPADESSVMGKTDKGNIDKKKLKQTGNWGDLPPKEQAEAKQYSEKVYPPHYRKIIEEYQKKRADQKRRP